MKIDKFFEQQLAENYPKASFLRKWWERKKFNVWLKIRATGMDESFMMRRWKETNEEMVRKLPEKHLKNRRY